MARRIVFKIALVLLAAWGAWHFLRSPVPDLVEAIDTDALADTTGRIVSPRTVAYEIHDVPLWTDRNYHTFQFVQRLAGRQWVPVGRNEEGWYALVVERPTTLLTLAYRADLRGVKEWTPLPDTVLVDDSYAPRRFDLMLALKVEAGAYRIRSPKGGPSKPVFFIPADAHLAP